MTDGENTTGDSADDFAAFYRCAPGGASRHPRLPGRLRRLGPCGTGRTSPTLTGGRLFDATKDQGPGSLDGAFEEIRGYQ